MPRHHRLPRALTALACALLASTTPAARVAQPAGSAAVEDLRAAVRVLKQVHPSPFTRITEATFDEAADALARELPALAPKTAALRIGALVSLIGDGHTTLGLGAPVFASDTTFPIRVERFADGLFVTAVRPADAALLGARVARINGIEWAAFWDRLATIASGDNVWSRMADLPLRLTRPELVAGLGLGDLDTLHLDVVTRGGADLRAGIPAVPVPFSPGWYGAGFAGPGGATMSLPEGDAGSWALSYKHPAAPYWFEKQGGTVYARINQLNDGQGAPALAAFWNDVLAAVDATPDARLVIDLRNNRGGNNAFARTFVDEIASRPGVNQRGRLFVLMGRRTFSAAMNFVSQLEDRTDATFVGEPAGGAPAHFGDAAAVTLPRSGLTLFVSTIPWTTGVSPRDVREHMEPALPAAVTSKDFFAGRDPALDAVARYQPGDILSDAMLAAHRTGGIDAAVAVYRERRAASASSDPWSSDVQQLLAFGEALIAARAEGRDIFRVYTLATETYPASPDAWAAQGRVLAFVRQWRAAEKAYARVLELRPAQPLVRRLHALARLQ